MANIDITNIDLGKVVLEAEADDFQDELLTFAGTDTFAAGTLLARSTTKLIPHVAAGGGATVVVAVLPYEVSRTGAGDVAIRALIGGKVNANRLLCDNGDSITPAVLDQLRSAGIKPVVVSQLGNIDNPQS